MVPVVFYWFVGPEKKKNIIALNNIIPRVMISSRKTLYLSGQSGNDEIGRH